MLAQNNLYTFNFNYQFNYSILFSICHNTTKWKELFFKRDYFCICS